MTARAVLFLFNVIETNFLRASSTSEFSHSLGQSRRDAFHCDVRFAPTSELSAAIAEPMRRLNLFMHVDAKRLPERVTESVMIQFANQAREPVLIDWVDFNGNEVQYGRVQPGERLALNSFAGHLWIAKLRAASFSCGTLLSSSAK